MNLLSDAPAPSPCPAAEPIGGHRLRDGRVALGLGLAFGHSDATALLQLVDAVGSFGAEGFRTAPGRVLLVIGLEPAAASIVAAAAARLGFVARPDDPRRHVAACAGMPLCASARIATRARAAEIALAAAPLLDGSLDIHLSGCAKGCAYPRKAALSVVGGEGGCSVVVDGAACDAPFGTIAADTLTSGFARLAHAVDSVRRPAERAADTLSRLGAERVVAILREAGNG